MTRWGDTLVTLHGLPTSGDLTVVSAVILGVAAVASVALAGLGIAAVARRRTLPYLFIAVALLTLSARTAVAVAALGGWMRDPNHLLMEHALDVVMASLILGAVYYARDIDVRRDAETATDPQPSRDGDPGADAFDDT